VRQSLLVVPAGLKWQWAQSIAKFTDISSRRVQLRKGVYIWVPEEKACVVVDGTPDKRNEAYQAALKSRPEFVIVSYEQVRNDLDVVKYLPRVQESVKQVSLHPSLRKLYRRISTDLSTALADVNMTQTFDLTQYYSGTLSSQLGTAAGDIMARTSALLMLCD